MHQIVPPTTTVTIPKKSYVLTTNKTMYAVHVKSKTKLICFMTPKMATKCRVKAAQYKHRFGKWPNRILDRAAYVDELLPKDDRKSFKSIFLDELDISEVETSEMYHYCVMNNMSLLICEYIKYEESLHMNSQKFHIKGTELDSDEFDYAGQINRFNVIWNNIKLD